MTPAIINGLTLVSRKAMGNLTGRASAFDGKHRLQRIFAGIHHFIIQPVLGFLHKTTVYKNSYLAQKIEADLADARVNAADSLD